MTGLCLYLVTLYIEGTHVIVRYCLVRLYMSYVLLL